MCAFRTGVCVLLLAICLVEASWDGFGQRRYSQAQRRGEDTYNYWRRSWNEMKDAEKMARRTEEQTPVHPDHDSKEAQGKPDSHSNEGGKTRQVLKSIDRELRTQYLEILRKIEANKQKGSHASQSDSTETQPKPIGRASIEVTKGHTMGKSGRTEGAESSEFDKSKSTRTETGVNKEPGLSKELEMTPNKEKKVIIPIKGVTKGSDSIEVKGIKDTRARASLSIMDEEKKVVGGTTSSKEEQTKDPVTNTGTKTSNERVPIQDKPTKDEGTKYLVKKEKKSHTKIDIDLLNKVDAALEDVSGSWRRREVGEVPVEILKKTMIVISETLMAETGECTDIILANFAAAIGMYEFSDGVLTWRRVLLRITKNPEFETHNFTATHVKEAVELYQENMALNLGTKIDALMIWKLKEKLDIISHTDVTLEDIVYDIVEQLADFDKLASNDMTKCVAKPEVFPQVADALKALQKGVSMADCEELFLSELKQELGPVMVVLRSQITDTLLRMQYRISLVQDGIGVGDSNAIKGYIQGYIAEFLVSRLSEQLLLISMAKEMSTGKTLM